MNELEETAAQQELKSMMDAAQRYKLLEAAVIAIKVLAVLYFVIAFHGLFLAPASETSSRSVSEKIGPIATVLSLTKDAVVAFLVYISGEIVRILLDIRRAVERVAR